MVIRTKIITSIALTIILAVGITTAILSKVQYDMMIRAKLQDTLFLCDIIERTTEDAMNEHDTLQVQKILESLGNNKEILELRIIAPDGRILRSTKPRDIGQKAPDFSADAMKSGDKPTLQNGSAIHYVHTIQNKKECYGCHNPQSQVIAYIDMKHDLSRNLATFGSLQRLLVFSNILVVIIVSAILSTLFSRTIMRPLMSLLSTIRRAGGIEPAVAPDGTIETSNASYGTMLQEIQTLYDTNIAKERELVKIRVELEHKHTLEELNSELEHKIRELETANKAITCLSQEVKGKNVQLERAVERLKKINDIGWILTSIVEFPELMRIIVRTTADMLEVSKATLHVNGSQRPAETIVFERGKGIRLDPLHALVRTGQYAAVTEHGKPLIFHSPDAPAIAAPIRVKERTIGAMVLENETGAGAFTEEDLDLLTTLTNHAMVAIENAWLYDSAKTNYFATIQSLVNALEANDRFTKGHSERVRLLSVELGKYLALDFKELELLEHASILHDIGKIGIDSFILQKQGRLTAREYSLIKTHPLIGDEILGPIGTLESVRKTIIQHHERYDGAGYPYGLKGNEILFNSKILSVVDTFDAMMTDRPYRKALTIDQVRKELRDNAGTQFDPLVVKAFSEMLEGRGEELLAAAGYTALYTP